MSSTTIQKLESGQLVKKCINCFQMKEVSQFYPKKEYLSSYCKGCNKEIKREWYRENVRKKIQARWNILKEVA